MGLWNVVKLNRGDSQDSAESASQDTATQRQDTAPALDSQAINDRLDRLESMITAALTQRQPVIATASAPEVSAPAPEVSDSQDTADRQITVCNGPLTQHSDKVIAGMAGYLSNKGGYSQFKIGRSNGDLLWDVTALTAAYDTARQQDSQQDSAPQRQRSVAEVTAAAAAARQDSHSADLDLDKVTARTASADSASDWLKRQQQQRQSAIYSTGKGPIWQWSDDFKHLNCLASDWRSHDHWSGALTINGQRIVFHDFPYDLPKVRSGQRPFGWQGKSALTAYLAPILLRLMDKYGDSALRDGGKIDQFSMNMASALRQSPASGSQYAHALRGYRKQRDWLEKVIAYFSQDSDSDSQDTAPEVDAVFETF